MTETAFLSKYIFPICVLISIFSKTWIGKLKMCRLVDNCKFPAAHFIEWCESGLFLSEFTRILFCEYSWFISNSASFSAYSKWIRKTTGIMMKWVSILQECSILWLLTKEGLWPSRHYWEAIYKPKGMLKYLQ